MYSKTQAGNIAVGASLVVLIARQFGLDVAEGEATQLLTLAVGLVGVIVSWYGRYKAGGITPLGVRE